LSTDTDKILKAISVQEAFSSEHEPMPNRLVDAMMRRPAEEPNYGRKRRAERASASRGSRVSWQRLGPDAVPKRLLSDETIWDVHVQPELVAVVFGMRFGSKLPEVLQAVRHRRRPTSREARLKAEAIDLVRDFPQRRGIRKTLAEYLDLNPETISRWRK